MVDRAFHRPDFGLPVSGLKLVDLLFRNLRDVGASVDVGCNFGVDRRQSCAC